MFNSQRHIMLNAETLEDSIFSPSRARNEKITNFYLRIDCY